MIELMGTESCEAAGGQSKERCDLVIDPVEKVELKTGDEVLVIVRRSSGGGADYGVPLRITDKSEPEENEIVLKYGGSYFVGQKIPEFI